MQDVPEFGRHERRAQGGFADVISGHNSSVGSHGYVTEWTLGFVSSVFLLFTRASRALHCSLLSELQYKFKIERHV